MRRNFLIWVGTVIGSCLATLAITDWWHEARGLLDVARVEIRAPNKPADKLVIGSDLAQKTAEHSYVSSLDSESTFEEVNNALEKARASVDLDKRSVAHVDTLVKLLATQSMAFNVDKRREELIGTLSKKLQEASWIERTAKMKLDEYEARLPSKYASHPAEAKNLTIHLEAGAGYNLSEEDEDEFAKREQARNKNANAYIMARREAHATNVFRRLLVYYEPEVLIEFFKACQAEMGKDTRLAEELISALTARIDQAREQHLYVSILITNSGDTPLPVQPIGILRLQVPNPNRQGSQTVTIHLTGVGELEETVIVEKGKPKSLVLMSRKPLRGIIEDNQKVLGGDNWKTSSLMSESRFMQLWQAKTAGLEASVKIARASLDPPKMALRESDRRPISLNSTELVYEQLEK